MKITEEQMTAMNLSEEAKALVRQQNAAYDVEKAKNVALGGETRKATVSARMTALGLTPLKNYPGLLREIEATMLSDDGDVALNLMLSDGQPGSQPVKVPVTVTQLCERFIRALTAAEEPETNLAETGTLLESPLSRRPDLTPETAGPAKPKTAEEMLAEWSGADPNVLRGLSSPENLKLAEPAKTGA